MRVLPGLALLLSALSLAAPTALAEEARFPVERFRPAIDGSGVLDVDSGQVGQHLHPAAPRSRLRRSRPASRRTPSRSSAA